jgi:hypothetical protein
MALLGELLMLGDVRPIARKITLGVNEPIEPACAN